MHIGLRRNVLRQSLVVISLGRNLFADELNLALILSLRLGQGRWALTSRSLRSVDFQLVGLRSTREQRCALLHIIAVGVADRLHKTLHARDQPDGIDRSGIVPVDD